MRDKLMERMGKKGKKLNPLEQKAKMDVVKSLSEQAGSMLGDKVKAMKQVTVAAPDKKGLVEGLEKAEDIIEGDENEASVSEMMKDKASDDMESDEEGSEMESEDEEESESDDMMEECKDMSPEELDDKIQKLLELKKEKLAKKE
jgi:hypothetical protein